MVSLWLAGGKWLTDSRPLRKKLRERSAKATAQEILTVRTKKIIKKIGKLRDLSAADRHRLRIAGKKLRYAIEFFKSLFQKSQPKRRKFGKALKDLQDALGKLNDIHVHQHLGDEVIRPAARSVRSRTRDAVAFGIVTGTEQADIKPLVDSARKSGSRLAKLPPFWE
jgi:CHAD domain-containing protein